MNEASLVVLTPERTIVTYPLAGLGSRVMAHLLDLMILGGSLFVVILAITQILGRIDAGIAQAVSGVIAVASPFLYFILFEGLMHGRTPGKLASGLRVRRIDGTPISFSQAVGRNLLRPADLIPGTYLLGLIAVFATPRGQRIGDLVAGTVVVREPRMVGVIPAAPHAAGIHPLEGAVGDLRGMTDAEYHALRAYADRFPEFGPEVRERLTREVWAPIAARVGVPARPDVHPIHLAEAVVMKYGRKRGML